MRLHDIQAGGTVEWSSCRSVWRRRGRPSYPRAPAALLLAALCGCAVDVQAPSQARGELRASALWYALADQWEDQLADRWRQGCRYRWNRVRVVAPGESAAIRTGWSVVLVQSHPDPVDACEALAHQLLHVQQRCANGGEHDFEHADQAVWQGPHEAGGDSLEAWSRRWCRRSSW